MFHCNTTFTLFLIFLFLNFQMWWLIVCVNMAGPQFSSMWSNTVLDVSMRIFLDEIDDESRLLSITWWASFNQSKAWMEQKERPLLSKRDFSCTLPSDFICNNSSSWLSRRQPLDSNWNTSGLYPKSSPLIHSLLVKDLFKRAQRNYWWTWTSEWICNIYPFIPSLFLLDIL